MLVRVTGCLLVRVTGCPLARLLCEHAIIIIKAPLVVRHVRMMRMEWKKKRFVAGDVSGPLRIRFGSAPLVGIRTWQKTGQNEKFV